MTSGRKEPEAPPSSAQQTPVKPRTRRAFPFPRQGAADLIVRPVYDQNTPITGDKSNPFGLPSNLEEQREAWRTLVPCHNNPRDLNDEIFTVKKISDHAGKKARLAPPRSNRLQIHTSARFFSEMAAKCLALILIVQHGEGSAKQGELDYNWALCREVFGDPFTQYYRNFVDGLRPRINDRRDQWTVQTVSMEAMKAWITTQGPCPVGCQVLPRQPASSKAASSSRHKTAPRAASFSTVTK
ncbi:hypothetical protein A1Q1_01517 [Trichosporon asahii var. asahii CBS 2479]|uniref:Uncharacterized protein n=1 Tax=Trichosporon asahii var. asahii (strain ATCC 90039 / CBS 2479 / JCM 2466 / KCTC 7840 / NBRC 103889/ NCYC 2677 / UAMH 7654) TaxID=1186058 RepID=J4UDR4_TRIAS|nr:hypothetical protein A1Q1_01517 [Trichosporon asahii var. asahii CBS 2479]EJT49315.1 hypothetical protein A1Q1_01517 [Trichosporon asahii var. asahii CBS 2479]